MAYQIRSQEITDAFTMDNDSYRIATFTKTTDTSRNLKIFKTYNKMEQTFDKQAPISHKEQLGKQKEVIFLLQNEEGHMSL